MSRTPERGAVAAALALVIGLAGAPAAASRQAAPSPDRPGGAAPRQPSATPRPASAESAVDWRTPAETSDYRTTPRLDETIAYLRRLAGARPKRLRLETFGRSGEGRPLVAAVASIDGIFDPEAIRRAGRPVVLVQNAIHAGEMDGKDASLALLRDLLIAGDKAALLARTVLVVLPIYNADGHERFGPYSRINQNGPEACGWRTQATNLNLNRDYIKADAPETRAFLSLWNRWRPDIFVDNHVTDGADYDYDTTWFMDDGPDVPEPQAAWRREVLAPAIEAAVTRAGNVVGPFIALKDDTDPSRGLILAQSSPRFSNGFATLRNRPGILVETHMLKDYRTRVRGTQALLEGVLEAAGRDADRLVRLNRETDAATVAAGRAYDAAARFPLRLEPDGTTAPFQYRGRKYARVASDLSGGTRIVYGPEPLLMTIPRETRLAPSLTVAPPRAYIVPASWTAVIAVLEAHGLRTARTSRDWTGDVETYRCEGMAWHQRPFEGRQVMFAPGEGGASRASPPVCARLTEALSFPAGSVIVPLDQEGAKVAIHFLEPQGPDSAVAWGFFNAVFEQKEYAEPYVMETMARGMMAADPDLRRAFEDKLAADRDFANSPEARLEFFYRRSPFWDSRLGLYPVGRLLKIEGLPIRPAGPPRPGAR